MRPTGERGAAAVLVLAVAAVLTLVGATVSAVAAVAVARQQAAAAADLAALAAADRALQGEQQACDRASRIAAANGATLVSCRVDGDVAEVVAQVRPPGRLGELGSASSRARAGPAAQPARPARAVRGNARGPPGVCTGDRTDGPPGRHVRTNQDRAPALGTAAPRRRDQA